MDLQGAIDFARTRSQGVLATIRRDGRPQLSNIVYSMAPDGDIRISIAEDRAKTKNLRRDPRGQLYVSGSSFWEYVVFDGIAELTPMATNTEDETVQALVDLYRSIRGEEHPDWNEYRRAMVQEQRIMVTLRPSSAVGLLRS